MSNISNPLRRFSNCFQDFFVGIDWFISYHVRPHGIGFGEVACTELLAMCMSQTEPPLGLDYPAKCLVQDINSGLKELGLESEFKASVNFQKFSQGHEGAVTQSDFALQFVAHDSTDRSGFLRKQIIFFQAKIANSLGQYETSREQEWRIDQLRSRVGQTGLQYCLYKPFEDFGIAVQDAHPSQKSDSDRQSWSTFMTNMLIQGYAGDEQEYVSTDQRIWREKLIESNGKANREIAEAVSRQHKNWTLFSPSIMTFEIDFPACELGAKMASKRQMAASASTLGKGRMG